MIKKLLMFASLFFPMVSNAAEHETMAGILFQLPSAEVLEGVISGIINPHFTEKTQLHEKLADKKAYALGVQLSVDCSIIDYQENFKDPMILSMTIRIVNMSKEDLIEAIIASSTPIKK